MTGIKFRIRLVFQGRDVAAGFTRLLDGSHRRVRRGSDEFALVMVAVAAELFAVSRSVWDRIRIAISRRF